MKSLVVVFALLLLPAAAAAETQGPTIRRLILMVALLDYPVEQGDVHGLLGLPDSIKPSIGGGSSRGTFWLWPLGEVNSALKVYYNADTVQTTGRTPLINHIEVVYHSRVMGSFVADLNDYPLSIAPRLKTKLKASGLSVLEFTRPSILHKYTQEVEMEMRAERNAALVPNKSAQPANATSG